MKNALIITRHYLDQNLGGPNCSKAFVRALADIYGQCTLIYPEHNEKSTDLSFIGGDGLHAVPCRDTRTRKDKLMAVYRGVLHRFSAAVKEALAHGGFDVVFIDHSFVASSGVIEAAKASGAKIVTLHHNVERNYLKDNKPNLLYRLPYVKFALEAERKAVACSDLNLTLTRSDADHFKAACPEKAAMVEAMGMFEYTDRKPMTGYPCGRKDYFAISGALSARQTETAILLFLSKYFQLLDDMNLGATLWIAGRNPSRKLIKEVRNHINVNLVPSPPDLLGVISRSKYYICPLHTGSGIKLRIMDALRIGMPVVAHKVSAHGYEDMLDKGVMFAYDDPESFEEAVGKMMDCTKSRSEVSDIYYASFSYDKGRERLEEILSRRGLV